MDDEEGPVVVNRVSRRTRGAGVLSLLAALVALTAGSCTSSADPKTQGSGGDTLVVDTSLVVQTLDPARTEQPGAATINHAVYDTLLTYKDGDLDAPVPSLATEYDFSDGGRRVTFTLRKDAKFADGTPVTAADVVFSLRRVKHLKGPASGPIQSVEVAASGEHTVVFTSKVSTTQIPGWVTSDTASILNAVVVKQNGGDDSPDAPTRDTADTFLNQKSAGGGPYVLDSISEGSAVLTANPQHWGEKPAYGRVVLQNADANRQRLDLLRGSAAIATDLSGDDRKELSDVADVKTSEPTRNWYLTMNVTAEGPTSNADFREAVRFGIDYAGLLAVVGDPSRPATGMIPTGFPGSLGEDQVLVRDVAKAKQALARSKFSNPKVTLAYMGGLTFGGITLDTVTQKIKADLAEVGIDVELTPQSIPAFITGLTSGKGQMLTGPRRAFYGDPSTWEVLAPGGTFANLAGYTPEYADASVNDALSAAKRQVSQDRRLSGYQDLASAVKADTPVLVPLFGTPEMIVSSKDLHGVFATAAGWRVDFASIRPRGVR